MLNKAKLQLLHIARRELQMDEVDYRTELLRLGGVESARDLDERGFDALMDRFKQLGFTSQRDRKGFFGISRPGMASPAQLALIVDLWKELVPNPSDASLARWLERHFSVSAVRFLTSAKANAVIGAMRAWQKRKEAEDAG